MDFGRKMSIIITYVIEITHWKILWMLSICGWWVGENLNRFNKRWRAVAISNLNIARLNSPKNLKSYNLRSPVIVVVVVVFVICCLLRALRYCCCCDCFVFAMTCVRRLFAQSMLTAHLTDDRQINTSSFGL